MKKSSSGGLLLLGALALGIFWLSRKTPAHGDLQATGQAVSGQGMDGQDLVTLDLLVTNHGKTSRLFEVGWSLTHPDWTGSGNTGLREIAAGQAERFGVVEYTPPFAVGDQVVANLALYSRPLDASAAVQDDAQLLPMTAI